MAVKAAEAAASHDELSPEGRFATEGNVRTHTCNSPRMCFLVMSCRKTSSLRANTWHTKSGQSLADCPASNSAAISGHFGLQVMVMNRCGAPYVRTMAMASCKYVGAACHPALLIG